MASDTDLRNNHGQKKTFALANLSLLCSDNGRISCGGDVVFVQSLRHLYLEQAAADLEARAYFFERQIFEHLDPLDEKAVDFLCKKVGKSASTRITVILPSGRVIGDTEEDPSRMDNHVDRPEIIEALTRDSGTSTRYSRTLDKEYDVRGDSP